ncbi:MAG: colanic acid/amylovoran biosynthesis glycosyltransferase [Ulvibacter sp.]|jgi:colanic acid/amylovoran biosynthesis glycosyltransferase
MGDLRTDHLKIAYITSHFPKLSETFILLEMVELKKLGFEPIVYSLIQEQENTVHAEVDSFLHKARFGGRASLGGILTAQLYWLRRAPLKYLSTWLRAFYENLFSPRFLMRSLVVVPTASWFAKEMLSNEINHIHAHWATHSTLAAWVANRLTNIPYSFTAHANDIFVDQTMLVEKIKKAEFVATISNYNLNLLNKVSHKRYASKIKVIPCGVDVAYFRPKHPIADRENRFVITCVGRLVTKKGQKYLLEACAQFKKMGADFYCQFVGDGPDLRVLEEIVSELNLEEHIGFLGNKARDEVVSILQNSSVMVLPSVSTDSGRMEGIPVVLMEAMSVELPVISTQISGIPELIDHSKNGLLVSEKDSKGLAEALFQIYDDPYRAVQMGKDARETILVRFDLKKNTKELSEFFRSTAVPDLIL